jgi:ATP-dependent DNA helicase RecG
LKGDDVAVVLVQPADAPPVRFKGTVWIRVGPRRAIASPQEERILAENGATGTRRTTFSHCGRRHR